MFLQYSEKNTSWGIDESYHRCYSFTKIKKDVEVFRKCAESLWKFNFRKVHDRRSKTFRCWFSSQNKNGRETARTKNGVVSGEALEKSAEGAMQRCRISQAKGQSQKRYRRKTAAEQKSGAQKRKNSGSAVFCCIFQSEPCSAGKVPQEMVFFFSKRCGCVIHIVQTIRRMEREKRKWMH